MRCCCTTIVAGLWLAACATPPQPSPPVTRESGCCWVLDEAEARSPLPPWVLRGKPSEDGEGLCTYGTVKVDPERDDLNLAFEECRLVAIGEMSTYFLDRVEIASELERKKADETCRKAPGSPECRLQRDVTSSLESIITSASRTPLVGVQFNAMTENCRCRIFRRYCMSSKSLARYFDRHAKGGASGENLRKVVLPDTR